jgi:uncharacterized protein
MRPAAKLTEALALLEETTTASKNHEFWADELPVSALSAGLRRKLVRPRQITDAYLLTLAAHRGGELVTFDRRMAQLASEGSREHEALTILTQTD